MKWLAFAVALTACAHAAASHDISVRVFDSSGRVLPGATVTIDKHVQVTSADGRTIFNNVIGPVFVRVQLTGFLEQTVGPFERGDVVVMLKPAPPQY